jgi:hypothetical protein
MKQPIKIESPEIRRWLARDLKLKSDTKLLETAHNWNLLF